MGEGFRRPIPSPFSLSFGISRTAICFYQPVPAGMGRDRRCRIRAFPRGLPFSWILSLGDAPRSRGKTRRGRSLVRYRKRKKFRGRYLSLHRAPPPAVEARASPPIYHLLFTHSPYTFSLSRVKSSLPPLRPETQTTAATRSTKRKIYLSAKKKFKNYVVRYG